jgi:hypothetical protein
MRSLKEEREITSQRKSIERPPQDPLDLVWKAIDYLCGHKRRYREDFIDYQFWYRFEYALNSIHLLDSTTITKEDLANVEFLRSMGKLIQHEGLPQTIKVDEIEAPNEKKHEIIKAFVSLFVSVIREERRFAEQNKIEWEEYNAKIEAFEKEHKEDY